MGQNFCYNRGKDKEQQQEYKDRRLEHFNNSNWIMYYNENQQCYLLACLYALQKMQKFKEVFFKQQNSDKKTQKFQNLFEVIFQYQTSDKRLKQKVRTIEQSLNNKLQYQKNVQNGGDASEAMQNILLFCLESTPGPTLGQTPNYANQQQQTAQEEQLFSLQKTLYNNSELTNLFVGIIEKQCTYEKCYNKKQINIQPFFMKSIINNPISFEILIYEHSIQACCQQTIKYLMLPYYLIFSIENQTMMPNNEYNCFITEIKNTLIIVNNEEAYYYNIFGTICYNGSHYWFKKINDDSYEIIDDNSYQSKTLKNTQISHKNARIIIYEQNVKQKLN